MSDDMPDTGYVPRDRKKVLAAMSAFFAALVLVSLVLAYFDLDRRISGLFYHPDAGFFLEHHAPWVWLYHYGTIPGLVFIALGILAVFLSTVSPKWKDIRRPAAIVVLTALLGSGILANAILKPYWGRPRPSQTTDFGGEWKYRNALSPGTPGKGQSFPSGHCTIAFLFTSAWFARRKYPRSAFAITSLGLVYGLFMSATRVVQGAHFVTDALWALGVIMLSAGFWDITLPDPWPKERKAEGKIPVLPAVAAVLGMLILVGDFAAHRPFFENHKRMVFLEPGITTLVVRANVAFSRADVERQANAKPRILFDSQGFGMYSARRKLIDWREMKGDTLIHHYEIRTTGWFSELNHSVKVILPESLPPDFSVKFETLPSDE